MAKLLYTAITSLDGYVADEQGKFDWSEPDAEVHAFVNDLERPIGTYLLGRRMYEVMVVWETIDDETPAIKDFAQIWRSKDKVVYSTTLNRRLQRSHGRSRRPHPFLVHHTHYGCMLRT